VGSTENLHLSHPNSIAVALLADLRSGRPADGGLEEADDWAPIERSYAGLPELTPDWVADHREALTLVEVRSEAEVQGPDGRIPGSLLIPLPELQSRAGEIPMDRPTVVLCHSGSRSALATQQLQKKGLSRVANLRGGLRAWKAQGLQLKQLNQIRPLRSVVSEDTSGSRTR
jgi:rhodanese-related sulfurtransferase